MCPKCGKALFVSADMYTLNAEFRQCICCGYEESIQPKKSLVVEALKSWRYQKKEF